MTLRGINVILLDKVQQGVDDFDNPIYEEVPIEIENVLIAPSSTDEKLSTLNLTGKHAVYTLAIPKEDTHIWENKRVVFFGKIWSVISLPEEGILEMLPLDWNKKVKVERYE